MEMLDITKSDLYINKIIKVIKSAIPLSKKLLYVNGRHSDAFVYIISGSCTYTIENERIFTAKAGDILYLAHHSFYTMDVNSTNYKFIFCDFEFDGDSERQSNVFSPKNAENTENLFNKLLHYYNASERSSFSKCMSVLYDIYGVINQTANRTYVSKNAQSKIARAKNCIDSGYNNPSLSIASLAEDSGMSEVYFRKLFKSQYDISPSQYLVSVRLKNAKELMSYPFFSLEECALQSGFSTLGYFCRVFKKEMGISPGRYRKSTLG